MQLPFLQAIMLPAVTTSWKLVPILVGSLSAADELRYGKILAPWFEDPQTLIVVSSDFCHWGERFDGFRPYDAKFSTIADSITALDTQSMKAIENGEPDEFEKTKNDICGRHAISIMMHAIRKQKDMLLRVHFIDYAQSSRVIKAADSSVSYAAAVVG